MFRSLKPSAETVLLIVVVAGLLGFGYRQHTTSADNEAAAQAEASSEEPVAATDSSSKDSARTEPIAVPCLLLPQSGPDSENFGYPSRTVDRLAVRKLLQNKSFDVLDAVLSAYTDSAVKDYRLEYRMFDAYAAFEAAIPSLEPLLNEWVERNPGSPPALVARGSFYYAMGQNARGYAFADSTTDAQFAGMDAYYRKAAADLKSALLNAPNTLAAYRVLMYIASYVGEHDASRWLLDKALQFQPYSFRLRAVHMENLTPRWGGSYVEMNAFADESMPYAQRNPRIAALRGYIDWDVGRRLAKRGRNSDAMDAFDRSLKSGDFWMFRYQRGNQYFDDDKYAEALVDLNKALEQKPQDADALYERAWIEYKLGHDGTGPTRMENFRKAWEDIALSVALDPADADHQEYMDFIRKAIPQFEHFSLSTPKC
ncbi:MAG TPA: DUF4034 domain-containing protein [Gemmatimonadaceae bacterium]|nr:DUF4034 domain-containing protein [Gemmatimonadaceae bacterium]